jgi:beta-lactamase regulating signal transducer with metallopeptidase domain
VAEALIAAGLRQALLLSLAIALLWASRPLVLARLGAGACYAAWLLVPLLLLTPTLPRPAQEPLHVVLQAAGAPATPALPVLSVPAAAGASVWLALWVAGAGLVLALQLRQQWRLARLGKLLPAGSSPALVGLLRPHVALPADFEQRFSIEERELILAHEQVHRERLDNLWNLFACVLAALHWWNPLAWWALRRMRADQELACDAAVLIAHPGCRPTYTQALMAAHDLVPARAPLASRWVSTHPLVERIAMLNTPRHLNRRRALLLAAVAATASALAYAAEGEAPADKGFIQLELKIERSLDGATSHRTAQTLRLIGKDGAQLRLRMDPIASDPPNWTTEPLAIELRPRQTDENQVLIETRISHGEPAVELGHPSVVTAWGQKARIEIGRPDTGEKFSLELTPTAAPADFKPPTNESAKPRP